MYVSPAPWLLRQCQQVLPNECVRSKWSSIYQTIYRAGRAWMDKSF